MNSLLRERFARLGPIRDVDRVPSGLPGLAILRPKCAAPDILLVDAAMALVRRGATMLRAKRTLERMADRGFAVISLPTVEDEGALRDDLGQSGVHLHISTGPRQVDVAALRERLHMTREQFALAYGLDQETLRNWEAGRRDPGPARAYLQAIANDPEGVMEAYTNR